MGIYDRDYYRDEGGGGNFLSTGARACKLLISITIIVYILQLFDQQSNILIRWLALTEVGTRVDYELWRLVTYAFLHDQKSLFHILFNMLALWWFGQELEAIYGSKEFGAFYLVAAFLSGVAFLLLTMIVKDSSQVLVMGASGAVGAVFVAFAYLYPRRIINIFGILPIEARWLAVLYFLFDLHPVILQIGGADRHDGVAHACHLGGAIFGFLYARNQWRLTPSRWRFSRGWFFGWGKPKVRTFGERSTSIGSNRPLRPRSSSHLKIFNGEADESNTEESESSSIFKKRVDEVLAKISREGQESLTPEEKKILHDASQKFRDKKNLS